LFLSPGSSKRSNTVEILNEKLVSLTEARKHFPNRPDKATVWRWYAKGLNGVSLETVVVGGRRFTSEEAIKRFIARRTETANAALGGADQSARARIERQESHDAAVERELDARGVGVSRRRHRATAA
jgi:hypothetical protein